MTKQSHMTIRPEHPLAPPSGVLAVARMVLYDDIGPGPHPCHWCHRLVDWTTGLSENTLVVDHLNFDHNDDTIDNLVPACIPCNSHRRRNGGAKPIELGELTVMMNKGPTRAVVQICRTCGKEFLAIPAVVKRGRGLYCSRNCMYDRNKTVNPPSLWELRGYDRNRPGGHLRG